MKDMTEKEASAALKKAMPWAKDVSVVDIGCHSRSAPRWSARVHSDSIRAFVDKFGAIGYGPTLRTAVRRCIAAAKKVGAAK